MTLIKEVLAINVSTMECEQIYSGSGDDEDDIFVTDLRVTD